MREHSKFGIYIHVPFCKQACSYCDFYFVTKTNLTVAYVEALKQEIIKVLPQFGAGRTPVTLYFGGGTPSRLDSKSIQSIMECLQEAITLTGLREVTLEANPDDLNPEYLATIREVGVTRLSMGIQSMDPDLLKFMNRAHDPQTAVRSLQMIKDAGFESYSVDLIYGNPGQTSQSLAEDIEKFLEFDPPHLSAYALTIEPGTRLGKYVELGRLQPPDDAMVAEHMQIVHEMLSAAGYVRYEVSNFAKPGFEAVHNSNYWSHLPYIGLGPGAHSFDWIGESKPDEMNGVRWANPADLKAYIEYEPEGYQQQVNREFLTLQQLAEERLLMGLRTVKGVSLDELSSVYDYALSDRQMQWIRKHNERIGTHPDGYVRLTDQGIPMADHIILELISRH